MTRAARGQITVGHALAASQVLTRAVDAGGMRSLDPSISTDVPAAHVLDDLFEGLTRLDERGEPEPGVASSWETSADGRTWTFHLREAHWSNGEPVRAADFVFAWRRTVDPATASDYAQALAPVANAIAISGGQLPVTELGIAPRRAHGARHAERADAVSAQPADQVLRLSAVRPRCARTARTGCGPNTSSATAPSCCANT